MNYTSVDYLAELNGGNDIFFQDKVTRKVERIRRKIHAVGSTVYKESEKSEIFRPILFDIPKALFSFAFLAILFVTPVVAAGTVVCLIDKLINGLF